VKQRRARQRRRESTAQRSQREHEALNSEANAGLLAYLLGLYPSGIHYDEELPFFFANVGQIVCASGQSMAKLLRRTADLLEDKAHDDNRKCTSHEADVIEAYSKAQPPAYLSQDVDPDGLAEWILPLPTLTQFRKAFRDLFPKRVVEDRSIIRSARRLGCKFS